MPSLIPGYEYDIFISYRQKDNKHDGWVTRFVENLKGEIEATFKEDISVYFDENPHDRLQETHNVDKSLEGKLKCLILIPILSQTYCDPNSFAWQYEFLPFLRMAEKDHFGKDIKLRSGNVASRILPIRIHDLEPEDVKLFEKETGSVLRAMDFVFKTSSGVNRPLKANEDHPQDNLNKTFYSDQINKAANAIKEIILGLKKESVESVEEKTQLKELHEDVKKEEKNQMPEKALAKSTKGKLLSGIVISAIIFIIIAVWIIPKIFHTGKNNIDRNPDGRISIAVNNFNNSSNDTSLTSLKIGIADLLRNDLAGSKELLVQNSQTMFELYSSMGQTHNASIVPSISREAAIKLRAGTYVTGSFQKFGDTILILAELNDTRTEEVLWSGKIKGISEKYADMTFSLSAQLKNFLEINVLKQKINPELRDAFTNSSEAYRKYIEGMQSLMKENNLSAIQSFQEAYQEDTTFSLAAFYTAYVYCYTYDIVQATKWTHKAYNAREKLPFDYRSWIELWEACYNKRDYDAILKYCDLLESSEIKSRYFWYDLGVTYEDCEVFDKAVNAFEKAETITKEWGEDWRYLDYYCRFGYAYHNVGMHDQESKIYEKGLKFFPDNFWLLYSQARCAISTGDSVKATGLITRCLKIAKEAGASESDIENGLGDLYVEANSLNKAEEHYRTALKLDSNNYHRINTLARFLIHFDRNVAEADRLSKKVLSIKPESPGALYVQGLVSYKNGKYKEALKLMQESKDISKIGWDTWLEKDLKKVKEALARQN